MMSSSKSYAESDIQSFAAPALGSLMESAWDIHKNFGWTLAG